ncbi:MAG: hypothetical protein OEW87_14330 [Flavobacteriaceae bacterium]|nr:hypothetical protein [Flavobacteriaceae bacterium]
MVVLFFITSCNLNNDISPKEYPQESNYFDTKEPMTVLGKQKENPYSVENMQKALKNLASNGKGVEVDIVTTDLYIRFLPKDFEELKNLYIDPKLDLWDIPLDREIEIMGSYYHDPTIPDNLPTYQYTVVKPDYTNPKVEYEILAELFLPNSYDANNIGGRTSNEYLSGLENEALRITGNLDQEVGSTTGGRVEANWRSEGTVRVSEVVRQVTSRVSTGNLLPVINVKVKAKRFFNLSNAYTNTNGFYRLGEFGGKVDYNMEFESDRVKITDFFGFSRNYGGPSNTLSGWSPTFYYWGEGWANSTVLNAAYKCRMQVNQKGLQTPFPTSFWAGGDAIDKLNIRTKFEDGTGDMYDVRLNEIRIFTNWNGGKSTDELYRVTFHELGHSMHYKLHNWNMASSNRLVRESYADYIEHYFAIEYYPQVASTTSRQTAYKTEALMEKGYTPVFIDLMDTDNQLTLHGGDRPNDNVQSYTFQQIEAVLKKSNKLEEIRDNLKNDYYNTSEIHLDDLFDFYIPLQ